MQTNAEYLRNVPLFHAVADEQVVALAMSCQRRKVARGEVVFLEGSLGNELFIIVGGKLRIERYDGDGSTRVLAVRGVGECVGEMALLDDEPRSATGVAQTELRLLVLGRDAFRQAVNSDPGLALAVMSALSQRLRQAADAVLSLTTKDVKARVLDHLRASATPDGTARLETSQAAFAELIGCSRETANRALRELASDGKLQRVGRSVFRLM